VTLSGPKQEKWPTRHLLHDTARPIREVPRGPGRSRDECLPGTRRKSAPSLRGRPTTAPPDLATRPNRRRGRGCSGQWKARASAAPASHVEDLRSRRTLVGARYSTTPGGRADCDARTNPATKPAVEISRRNSAASRGSGAPVVVPWRVGHADLGVGCNLDMVTLPLGICLARAAWRGSATLSRKRARRTRSNDTVARFQLDRPARQVKRLDAVLKGHPPGGLAAQAPTPVIEDQHVGSCLVSLGDVV